MGGLYRDDGEEDGNHYLGFRVFGALNPKSMFEQKFVGCGCLKMRTRLV